MREFYNFSRYETQHCTFKRKFFLLPNNEISKLPPGVIPVSTHAGSLCSDFQSNRREALHTDGQLALEGDLISLSQLQLFFFSLQGALELVLLVRVWHHEQHHMQVDDGQVSLVCQASFQGLTALIHVRNTQGAFKNNNIQPHFQEIYIELV